MPNEMELDAAKNTWYSLDQDDTNSIQEKNARQNSVSQMPLESAGPSFMNPFDEWISSSESVSSPQVPALDNSVAASSPASPFSTPRSPTSEIPENLSPGKHFLPASASSLASSAAKAKLSVKAPSSRRRSSLRPMTPMHLLPKLMPSAPTIHENVPYSGSPYEPAIGSPLALNPDGTSSAVKQPGKPVAELATDKRAYHKLAEQNRRNRLNNAIKELESLIPEALFKEKFPTQPIDASASAKEKAKAAPKEQTKADVMELAVEHITQLRARLDDENRRLQELDAIRIQNSL
ncbi:uncharacterized protein N7483_003816 [Penicillium malachiteum]|uniref:uncharacterized protein n=1 Tax=Penicillium malachiteum TaxID=1324776 RepID=UPI002548BADD|nr:uncharacterized protein N7483_003816 [Penicillium malachiteum]KAJ5729308.1 hypothetical protein N7483_003816 [Penicillium malachiteum]